MVPATHKALDLYDVYCDSAECGAAAGGRVKLNVEPLNSVQTVQLRNLHNETFHQK